MIWAFLHEVLTTTALGDLPEEIIDMIAREVRNDLDLLRIAAFLDVQVAIRDPSVRCPFPSRFRGLRKYASDVEAKVRILHHYRL